MPGFFIATQAFAASSHWPLNGPDASLIIHGDVRAVAGVVDQSIVLDGGEVIELKDSAALNPAEGFTLSVWFNPHVLADSQQMIAAKNRYSLHERQWGIAIEPDGKLKAYLQQGGWSTITCKEPLQAGHWHLATLTVTHRQGDSVFEWKVCRRSRTQKTTASHPGTDHARRSL